MGSGLVAVGRVNYFKALVLFTERVIITHSNCVGLVMPRVLDMFLEEASKMSVGKGNSNNHTLKIKRTSDHVRTGW